MGYFQRKAVLGTAAVMTAGAAAFMTMGTAHAATATPAAQTAAAVRMAPAPAAFAFPMVRQGAVGERVYAVQYLLNAHGARLATDGHFGPATAAAVRSFQSRYHLQVDGQVGPQTWMRLIVEVRQGNRGAAVSAVQHNLRYAYGYTKVGVDGQFGPVTNAAVRSFQARFKIGVDGIVGMATWSALLVHEG